MSLFGHDDVIIYSGIYSRFILTCQFFILFRNTQIALHSKSVIHELWEEVMNFNQLITFDLDIPSEVFEP